MTAIVLVIGIVLGAGIASFWWRLKLAQARIQGEFLKRDVVEEVTKATADAAAERVIKEFRNQEELTERNSAADLARRENALTAGVEALVKPVKEQLELYQKKVDGFQRDGSEMHGELRKHLEMLSSANTRLARETNNLTTALRKPEVRGSWGEQQLRRIIELAGMVEYCDFEEQVSISDSMGARQRPDVIVHLPNSREVIIDAKVPFSALLDGLAAMDTDDESARVVAMRKHASQLRSHIDDLSKRAYWKGHEGSVDFVVAFVPNDSLLCAALDHDPEILEYALTRQVLLATPTNLIALLKAISYGWRQEQASESAQAAVEAGRELYARVKSMADHVVTLGRHLRLSVETYNKFVGSIESRVLTQARRFEQLEVVGPEQRDLSEVVQITEFPRQTTSPELSASDSQTA